MNRITLACLLLGATCLGGCDSGVSDDEGARLAYLGADGSVALALGLGFDGFNAASSANITPQIGAGQVSGRLIVGGQVDQGNSDNKGMRLTLTYENFADPPVEDIDIVYDSQSAMALDLSMKGLPAADLSGTLVGEVLLSGDLEGSVFFNLAFTGFTEADPTAAGDVRRVAGSTHVTGTAVSDYGRFVVDLIR